MKRLLVPVSFVLLATVMASAAIFSGMQAVKPYDVKAEGAAVRRVLEESYKALNEAITVADAEKMDEFLNEYFEEHLTLAGMGEDDDYTSREDFISEVESGDRLLYALKSKVPDAKTTTKINSIQSARRFASVSGDATSQWSLEQEGKKMKVDMKLTFQDIWQFRKTEADDSKRSWQLYFREIVAVEFRLDGKVIPVDTLGQ